ncbi:branched-chain amino acid aminotransferase [Neobacillus sp. LXY-1]|uniref:branched-chain amino acid aminotransferase n=1 Tax=Neobacillus sp. LXY-1 TaxID=3379133 RepID=UPI003EE0704D
MLKEHIKQFISALESEPESGTAQLFKEEKEYAEKHGLTLSNLAEEDAKLRFADSYIERCDKETENMIRNEESDFLEQPLVFLKKRKNEFIYLESKWFDIVHAESVSLEADDVFGTYDVMLGLKLQKKYDNKIREFLNSHLHSDEATFDLMFNSQEGMWDFNFALNYVDGFDENMSIGEAYQLIYKFLFTLLETIETE